jgi:hypothetical protein
LKIGRVEAFVEPGIDWREDVTGFGTATLRAQQASEADGIARLVGARTLLLRDGERPAGTSFDSRRVGRGKRWSKSPRNRWSSELAPRAPLNTTSNGLIRAAGALGKMPMQTSLDALPLVKETHGGITTGNISNIGSTSQHRPSDQVSANAGRGA